MASSAATPPALQEATKNSTSAWQDDLQALFEQAQERFPDVVWELSDGSGIQGSGVEEIWGHKGAFQVRDYLQSVLPLRGFPCQTLVPKLHQPIA